MVYRQVLQPSSHIPLIIVPLLAVVVAPEKREISIPKTVTHRNAETAHVAAAVRILVKMFRIVNGAITAGIEHIIDIERKRSLVLLQKIFAQTKVCYITFLILSLRRYLR